jgi:hypothetical protein
VALSSLVRFEQPTVASATKETAAHVRTKFTDPNFNERDISSPYIDRIPVTRHCDTSNNDSEKVEASREELGE